MILATAAPVPAAVKLTANATTRPAALQLAGRHVHFVGIGGCGMSGLARMAHTAGARCTGSDLAESPLIEELRRAGVPVTLQQTAQSVPIECQLLVISAAVKPDHPEVKEARRRGLTVLKYAQMLGQLMIGRCGIAIAGTHGKSSTTSMLAHVLIQCGLDPSVIVGATCQQIGGGARSGNSNLLVAEACEFDRSFHNFHPTLGAILNVEADHLDVYKSLDEIVEAFAVFARRLDEAGPDAMLLINHEMPHRLTITAGLHGKVETVGFAPQADWRVEVCSEPAAAAAPPAGANPFENGPLPVVRLHRGRQVLCEWRNPMPGEHMAYNAAAAAILAHRAGAPWEGIAKALASFLGLDRRMQFIGRKTLPGGTPGSALVVDDYGHHPTEIDTTLRALRAHYHPRRLVCVFQPHQHSRTRFLLDEFAQSFSQADLVIVPHIYFVRDSEQEKQAVTAGDLVDRLRQRGRQAMHLYPFEAIVEQLQVMARPGDLIVTMGAGDVWKVARDFLKA